MRKVMSIVLCIAIAVAVAFVAYNHGGAENKNVIVKSPTYPKGISFHDFDNQIRIRRENVLDESYQKALESFSYLSASKLLRNSANNICYSPMSLYMALSIAGTGAKGVTKDEILNSLCTNGKDINYLSEQNSKLFKSIYLDNNIGKLKIANSLWLQRKLTFKEAFLNNAVKNFYASIYSVDFNDPNTSKLMNKWISQNTNGVLDPKIDLQKNQIMSILNTIYYKDEWRNRFDRNNTKPDIFYRSGGNKVKCDFMNNTFFTHGFTKGEGYIASSLGLKNQGEMIFVLPDKGVSIDQLLTSPKKIEAVFKDPNKIFGKVIFKIPKFSFNSDMQLKSILESMGIKKAFQDTADFSGITNGVAYISNVEQQTHVAIDEKGVEAAAYTQIVYNGSAPPKKQVAEMILNRPFVFAVKSHEKLLFIGVFNNPADK